MTTVLAWSFLALLSPALASAGAGAAGVVTEKGVQVELSLAPESPVEGGFSDVRFRVTDAATGNPVAGLRPAVWISRSDEARSLSCHDRISRHLQGMLSFQADVDLNKYFILILNDDQTISVVDPLLGVSGITQLFGMVVLEDRGTDWARSADGEHLFVTMSRVGKVAVIDLETFEGVAVIEVGPEPGRIALQPDGRYLWVAHDGSTEGAGGVSVVDAWKHTVVARIATGPGRHDIAFSDDSLLAFVTNGDGDTLSIVDVPRLEKLADLEVGEGPVAVEYSALADAAYAASRDGTVTVVDATTREVVRRIETGAGLEDLRFDPTGRWGFAALGSLDRVDVLDASKRAVVHRLPVRGRPHQISFTDTYAYVRHLESAEVILIPLAQLGLEVDPSLQSVALGTRPPGEPTAPAVADSIVPTGEWTAVVAANPSDRQVYYYMEGMIAPMGSYSTYGRVPRAVAVVDRSLRETDEGVYTARFRVPDSGEHTVAFLLDSPWLHHCFTFTAAPDPARIAEDRGVVELRFLTEEREVAAGAPVRLVFSLARRPRGRDGAPLAGLQDVTVLATRPPGVWQRRQRAEPLEGGLYQAVLDPDSPGAYYVSVAVPSLGLDFTELPFLTLRAVDRESSPGPSGGGH